MLEFPRWIYRGEKERLLVNSQSEYDLAMTEGWRGSVVPEPENTVTVSEVKPPNIPLLATQETLEELQALEDNSPPTRAELEEKADELGIRYQSRTTDQVLHEKISQRLKALGE